MLAAFLLFGLGVVEAVQSLLSVSLTVGEKKGLARFLSRSIAAAESLTRRHWPKGSSRVAFSRVTAPSASRYL